MKKDQASNAPNSKEGGDPKAAAAGSTAATSDAGANKSKNQRKKETRDQTNQKFWDEVAAGLRPDPRIAKAEKKKQEAEKAKQTGQASGKGQAKAAGGQSKKGSAAAPASTGATAKSSASTSATSTANQGASASEEPRKKSAMQTSLQYDDPKRKASAKKKQIINRESTPRELDLFSHMPQKETYKGTVSDAILLNHAHIPAPFVTFGLQAISKQIQGSNARNLALIDALMAYLEAFIPSPQKQYHVDLDTKLKSVVQFVVDSRALSIGQGNIINFLKHKMSELGADPSLSATEEARRFLIRQLKSYKEHHIISADIAIQEKVSNKVQDQDVILTFGRSYVVSKSLQQAALNGKRFKVIILDTKPRFEGVRTLEELADHGIELEYAYLNAISYFMKGVTKVLIGASAFLGNGHLYSRAGSSLVCMMAHTYRVPVLVACETYKFTDKVQLDSITRNEVDDPDLLARPNHEGHCALKSWKSLSSLKMLNLIYDVTPAEFIDMIITEHGPVPPTSVSALIREFHTAF